jgi:hypothetical protein
MARKTQKGNKIDKSEVKYILEEIKKNKTNRFFCVQHTFSFESSYLERWKTYDYKPIIILRI